MKNMFYGISIVTLLALLITAAPGTVQAQEFTCDTDVVVQADDWLSKLADKFYGDVLAYQVIADATNQMAASDDSYATIADVNVIEPGWKLCVPSAEQAETIFGELAAAEAEALATVSQVLKAGKVGNLRSLEPYRNADPNYIFIEQTFDQLLFNERSRGVKAEAAESWELAPDSMSITVKLRPGMVTHDGSPVDAEMVRWDIEERITQKDKGVAMYNQFNPYYESVEVLDPLTLKINFNQPAPHAADLLALLAVADPDMFVKDDGTEALGNEEDKQIASGAFKMVEYVPDSHIYFEGFEDYWEAGIPKLDRIEVSIFGDAASMVAALEAGEVEYIFNPPYEDAARLMDNPDFTVHVPQTQGVSYILMVNPERPALNDVRVRQAINYAIDRESLNAAAFAGLGIPTSVCFPPGSLAYSPDLEIGTTANAEQAQALLAEAGVTDLSIGITVPGNNATMMTIAQVLAANLQAAGIDAQVDAVEQNIWVQNRVNQEFDTLVSLIAGTNKHPAGMEDSFVYAHTDNQFFDDIEPQQEYLDFQAAFEQGMAATSAEEARAAWLTASQAIIDGAWVDCLAGVPFIGVTSNRVKGFTWTEADKPVFKYTYLAAE